MRVNVRLSNFTGPNGGYEADFLVDTGATDSLAPAAELRKAGIQPVGKTKVRTACGSGRVDLAKDCSTTVEEFEFGLAEITFMGEVTAGRVIFGPHNIEPLLGVTALESVGITIDPATRRLKRLPALPLK